jgi:hypothetical protein
MQAKKEGEKGYVRHGKYPQNELSYHTLTTLHFPSL